MAAKIGEGVQLAVDIKYGNEAVADPRLNAFAFGQLSDGADRESSCFDNASRYSLEAARRTTTASMSSRTLSSATRSRTGPK
jgi:hypothetical protein